MHHPILNLGSAPLIPELRSEVAAGAATDIQRPLIAVAAVRALPDQLAILLSDLYLAVKAAGLTVIGFRIKLCIEDRFVDMLHQSQHCRDIVLKVWHLDITDRTARRKLLKFCLEGQLAEASIGSVT